jgi:serine phosphatase RsbU (regulator of sigma subunit)
MDVVPLLRALRESDPTEVVDVIAAMAASFGGTDVVAYLVDLGQHVLEPLPDRRAHGELPAAEEVEGTMAGRALLHRQATVATRKDGVRVWVPVVEGSDATGVLALTLAHVDSGALELCEQLGVLAGYVIAVQTRVTDLYNLHRRRRSMTLAASLQWDLLPPLTLVSRSCIVAGMLEPAYEIGGDSFDYALNGSRLDLAIMDSMGHGLGAATVAGLAIGSYRHDRREARSLEHIHHNLDSVVAAECEGSFVTGLLGQVNTISGRFTWINAGHPEPLLIRHGHVAGSLPGGRALPWGVGPAREVSNRTIELEPGDSVLFYTDGVTEARFPKEGFGLERLADLVGRHSSDQVPLELIVRTIARLVVEHHGGRLHDDATLLMVKWPGPAGQSS